MFKGKILEALLIKLIKEFAPPSVIADAFDKLKTEIFTTLRTLAADTGNKIDDLIVDKVEEVLNSCTPDAEGVCALIKDGKVALIALLRKAAQSSENGVDDAMVDLLEQALLEH